MGFATSAHLNLTGDKTMGTVQQRFEVERPLASVYDAVARPVDLLEILPGVTGVQVVNEDVYRLIAGSSGATREIEVQIVSRAPGHSVAWRTADGKHFGTISLETLDGKRTAVTVQADTTAGENEALPASVVHDAVQALKRALQSPQVRITQGSGAREGGDFRRFASDLRHARGLFAQAADPFGLMRTFSRQFERVFGDAWRTAAVPRLPGVPDMVPILGFNPKVEVCEQQEQVRVCVDVPGVDENGLEIEIDAGALVIRGERRDARAQEPGQRRSEVYYGRFTRRVPLPEGIDRDNARATLRNGVLEILIPLTRTQPRRVPVEHTS